MTDGPAPEPFALELSNAPHVEYWTCPGCYADLWPKDGFKSETTATCPACNRPVELSIELQPVYVSAIALSEEVDDV